MTGEEGRAHLSLCEVRVEQVNRAWPAEQPPKGLVSLRLQPQPSPPAPRLLPIWRGPPWAGSMATEQVVLGLEPLRSLREETRPHLATSHTPALSWPCRAPPPPIPFPPPPLPVLLSFTQKHTPRQLGMAPPRGAILSLLGPRVQPSLSCPILFTSFLPRFVFRFSHLCARIRGRLSVALPEEGWPGQRTQAQQGLGETGPGGREAAGRPASPEPVPDLPHLTLPWS